MKMMLQVDPILIAVSEQCLASRVYHGQGLFTPIKLNKLIYPNFGSYII